MGKKNTKNHSSLDREVEKKFNKIFKDYLNTGNDLKVDLQNITKVYDNGIKAIDSLNLEINKGEFIVLLGPSGCGKTTTLRMIAGLETISSGYLKFNNVIFNNSQPKNRKISMVFQNYALYPFMNVYDNIAYGLKNKKRSNDVYKNYTKKIKIAKNSNYQKILDLKTKKQILKEGTNPEIKDEILNLKRDLKTYKVSKSKEKYQKTLTRVKELQRKISDHKNSKEIQSQKLAIAQEIANLQKSKNFDKEKYKKLLRARQESVDIWKKYIPVNINNVTKMLGISDFLKRRPAELSGGQRQRVALARAISKKVNLYLYDEPLSNLDAKLRAKMRTEIRKIHDELNATSIYVTHDQIEAMSMADKIVVMHKGYIQQFGTPLELINKPANLFVANFIGNTNLNMFESKHVKGTTFSINQNKLKITNSPLVDKSKFQNKKVVLAFRPEHVIVDKQIVRNTQDNKFSGEVVFREMLGNDVQLTLNVRGFGEINILASVSHDFQLGENVEFVVNMNKINLFDLENGFNILFPPNKINKKAKETWLRGEEERIKNNTLIKIQRNKLTLTEWIRNGILAVFSEKARKNIALAKDKSLSTRAEKKAE